jgi:hypothetical protein
MAVLGAISGISLAEIFANKVPGLYDGPDGVQLCSTANRAPAMLGVSITLMTLATITVILRQVTMGMSVYFYRAHILT